MNLHMANSQMCCIWPVFLPLAYQLQLSFPNPSTSLKLACEILKSLGNTITEEILK